MTKIKAIGFDFGGVVGGNPNLGQYFTEQNAKLLGITANKWREAYFSMNSLLNAKGSLTKEVFWRQFLQKFNQVDKLSQVLQLDSTLAKQYMVINQEIITLIDQLRRSGYKVGLLSNATGIVANNIRNLSIEDHFDTFLFSIDIKAQKPDCLAFSKLASALGVSTNELVFVDDATKSLSNSSICGFTPILFKSITQLKNELTKLGITY